MKIRPVTRGGRRAKPSLENISPSWENVLDTVENYWTKFKKFRSLSENSSPFLVSQAGYEPGENHDVSFEAPFTLRLAGHFDMFFFRCFCL